jgi:hypothetical protein
VAAKCNGPGGRLAAQQHRSCGGSATSAIPGNTPCSRLACCPSAIRRALATIACNHLTPNPAAHEPQICVFSLTCDELADTVHAAHSEWARGPGRDGSPALLRPPSMFPPACLPSGWVVCLAATFPAAGLIPIRPVTHPPPRAERGVRVRIISDNDQMATKVGAGRGLARHLLRCSVKGFARCEVIGPNIRPSRLRPNRRPTSPQGSDIERLGAAGVPVRCDRDSSHMHHKVCGGRRLTLRPACTQVGSCGSLLHPLRCLPPTHHGAPANYGPRVLGRRPPPQFVVLDGRFVLTGSFNWTRAGVLENRGGWPAERCALQPGGVLQAPRSFAQSRSKPHCQPKFTLLIFKPCPGPLCCRHTGPPFQRTSWCWTAPPWQPSTRLILTSSGPSTPEKPLTRPHACQGHAVHGSSRCAWPWF